MATSFGRQATPLAHLLETPEAFDFFQAVRLLECVNQHNRRTKSVAGSMIGSDDARHEFLKFHTVASSNFPAGLIEKIQLGKDLLKPNTDLQAEQMYHVWTTFMGLTGANGVLPQHYTQLVVQQYHQGNSAMQDFFDIFNHRILSLFYLAWEKYHFLIAYERKQSQLLKDQPADTFSQMILSLLGMAFPASQSRLLLAKEIFQYYAGLFRRRIRSALALEGLLNDYFKLPIRILQFQGKWLSLKKEDRSILSYKKSLGPHYQRLGMNVILGPRCWDIQSKFRIYIKALNYPQFQDFLPTGQLLKPLIEMSRFYVGPQFNFDLQLQLLAAEVPACPLRFHNPMRLGWNTWLKSQPFEKYDDQAVIRVKE